MPFDADIRHFRTPAEFATYLARLAPPPWVGGSTVHNTYRPDEAQWAGLVSMNSMRQTYIGNGWTAGPHLYLAADTSHDGIWQMTPVTRPGVHAGSCNSTQFGIEVVGNFHARPWSAAQRSLLLDVLEELHRWTRLPASAVNSHRDCMPGRTCPGDAAYAAMPQLRVDLTARLAQSNNTAVWSERWGTIATPDQVSWSWALSQTWRQHWRRLGRCISHALYDNTNNIVIQNFERGAVRCIGGRCEVLFK